MYEGKVVRPIIVRDSVMFTSIEIEEASNPIQMVLFRKHRPTELCKQFLALGPGDKVKVHGSMERNPQTGENQIVVNGLGENAMQSQSKEKGILDPFPLKDRQVDTDDSWLDTF